MTHWRLVEMRFHRELLDSEQQRIIQQHDSDNGDRPTSELVPLSTGLVRILELSFKSELRIRARSRWSKQFEHRGKLC